MSNTDQFLLFVIACFAIGIWWRMATKGMTFMEALKDCFRVSSAPLRVGGKVGYRGFKIWRRM